MFSLAFHSDRALFSDVFCNYSITMCFGTIKKGKHITLKGVVHPKIQFAACLVMNVQNNVVNNVPFFLTVHRPIVLLY